MQCNILKNIIDNIKIIKNIFQNNINNIEKKVLRMIDKNKYKNDNNIQI